MGLEAVYGHESKAVQDTLTELFSREKELETACINEANTEYAYKIKDAEEFLKAEGTVEAKKAAVKLACKTQYEAYLKASAVKEFTKCKWQDCLAALNARQSILSASAKGDFNYAINRQVT